MTVGAAAKWVVFPSTPTEEWAMLMSYLGRHRRVVLAAGPAVGAAVGVITNVLTSQWSWWLFLGLLMLVSIAAGLAAVGGSGEHVTLRVLASGSRALHERVADCNGQLNAILDGAVSPFARSVLDDVAAAETHASTVSRHVQLAVTHADAAAGNAVVEVASDRWSRVLLTHPRLHPDELLEEAANVEGVTRGLAEVQRDVLECQRFVGALRNCIDDALAARQPCAAATVETAMAKAALERVESCLASAATNVTRYARGITNG